MNISELPDSDFVARVSRRKQLEEVFRKALAFFGKTHFAHSDNIRGGDSSVRVFSSELFPGSVEFPRHSAFGLANLLVGFAGGSEVRYPEQGDKDSVKGWEIRLARLDNKPVLIAQAAWVQR